jgi:hypothetical protein
MSSTATAANTIVMVRPLYFSVNEETAADNAFQGSGAAGDAARAVAEFDEMADQLRAHGIEVVVFDQSTRETPDAVFPNNWFSTHEDGTLVLYPMYAPSRRAERRPDIIRWLETRKGHRRTIDLSPREADGIFLEGTGAIVFDHRARTAYLTLSRRADAGLFAELCETLGYEGCTFSAADRSGTPVYHTNVVMSVGPHLALIGTEMIADPAQRREVRSRIADQRAVIDLTAEQVSAFAGNALELRGNAGPVLVLSQRGWDSLDHQQKRTVADHVEVLAVRLPTIEKSGGSARCMIAELAYGAADG